jgi:GNAT superfamily N-acetyltransferase
MGRGACDSDQGEDVFIGYVRAATEEDGEGPPWVASTPNGRERRFHGFNEAWRWLKSLKRPRSRSGGLADRSGRGARKIREPDPVPADNQAICPLLRRWAAQLEVELGLEDFFVYDLPNGDLVLSLLVVPRGMRKQGKGTEAMQALVELADHNGRRIWLTPNEKDINLGTTSRGRLVRFYRGFGFVENKGRNKDFRQRYSMYRRPGGA